MDRSVEATLANMVTSLKSLLDPFPVLVLSFSIRSLSSLLPSWSRSMWWSSFSRRDLDDCQLLYYANTSRDITSVHSTAPPHRYSSCGGCFIGIRTCYSAGDDGASTCVPFWLAGKDLPSYALRRRPPPSRDLPVVYYLTRLCRSSSSFLIVIKMNDFSGGKYYPLQYGIPFLPPSRYLWRDIPVTE